MCIYGHMHMLLHTTFGIALSDCFWYGITSNLPDKENTAETIAS